MANNDVPDFQALAAELLSDLSVFASVTALNFFKESFDVHGWRDNGFSPWAPRADEDTSRAILVKSGHLRDSLRIITRTTERVEIGTSAPYAEIHNQGGRVTVRVTPKARKYFWYMYQRTDKPFWKNMALTKKDSFVVNIPKRQFIGNSKELTTGLDAWVVNEILRRFNGL
jgi:phage gpG-like protein